MSLGGLSLGGLFAARNPSRTSAQCLFSLPLFTLSLINMSREGRRGFANSCHGLRHSACRCISPLIIYVTRLLFRHHPSSSQTTNVIANVVAKYLDLSTYMMLDLTTGKAQRKQGSAQHIASSLTVQGFGWLMRALKA